MDFQVPPGPQVPPSQVHYGLSQVPSGSQVPPGPQVPLGQVQSGMLCSPSGLGTHDSQPQETSHVQGHILEGLRQVSHASGQFLEGLRHTWSGFGSQGFTGNEVEGESRHGVNKVTVVIDGVTREGIVDTNGAVQVIQKGPEYFSIASEEPELSTVDQTVPLTAPPLPSFGRPASSREIGSPFDPKARSPFRPTTPPPPPPSFGEEEKGRRGGNGFLLGP